MLRKNMGRNQRSANFPLGFAPKNGPHQVSSFFGKLRKKPGGLGGVRFPGPSKLPERRRLQKIVRFQGHRWRNSHSFAKIRLEELPHISRHPSTNLTKICHIGVIPRQEGKTTRKDIRGPFWDIDGATASCLGITLIVAYYAYFG